MPPSTLFCPKCGNPLTVSQPAPEKVTCGKCRSVIKIAAPARAATVAQPASYRPAAALAPTTAHVKTGKTGTVAGLRIQDELASGGLGVVYLAYHLALKDFRAVKRPKSDAALNRDLLLARFRREVEALGGLYSSHIVRAYDAGADDEGPYLVTEYLDGAPLSRLVERLRRLPAPEACELVRQAALGLQAAHERGLVHRDVKPSNLMLVRDAAAGAARVVVIDWGLVKRAGESHLPPAPALTGLGLAMGTADYMAPEQVADARGVDIRADVYGLGATLYYLLAGRPPFAGRSDEEKLLAHQREPFPPLDRVRSDLPADLLDVLQRMVEKQPPRRYATPGEAANALQPFCRGVDARQLLQLLDRPPAPPQEAPVVHETKDIFQQKTVLGSLPTPSGGHAFTPQGPFAAGDAARAPTATPAAARGEPGPPVRRILVLLGGAAGLLLVLTALAVGVWALSGGSKDENGSVAKNDAKDAPKNDVKDTPKSNGPQVLIDEDFSQAVKARQTLPDGWTGDAFRVVKDHDQPCLETSKPAGEFFVKLPPVSLAGDFLIEVACVVDLQRPVVVRLEARKTNALLPITLSNTGQVSIGDDVRLAPPGFKPYTPANFQLKRERNKLRVFLNGEAVADKDLDVVNEYESMQLGMGAGPVVVPGGSKVFRLKVVSQSDK